LATQATSPRPTSASGAEAPAPAIELAGLRRDFGELAILRDVDLSLPTGETLCVLGPNGAGKTTLLRILATLLRPSGGEVRVLGEQLPRRRWRARGRIGYLGHEPLLYRDLTVAENLLFHARLHGLPGAGAERSSMLLDAAGLGRRGDELVRNLSAGMAQRAAACRAVLHEPELLLLDEPWSHLDPVGAALVDELIGPAPGRTRVVVSHDVEAGLAEADRALALRADGTVVYEGAAGGLSAGDALAIYAGGAVR